uniref:Uncharacterized protein n=1 Tax=Arundo donax TaxID=35708 RepID=A0A0A9FP19_ARUDO
MSSKVISSRSFKKLSMGFLQFKQSEMVIYCRNRDKQFTQVKS